MDYKGVKISNKVIIVERTSTTDGGFNWHNRTINQGYVVDEGNKKMLDSALSWASWTKYPDDNEFFGEGKHRWSDGVTQEQRDAYNAAVQKMEGVMHTYDNGQFEITLSEAAGNSSQSGKLSFWNCIIKAPDNKEFLVGINSDLLLHLLCSNTLVNGTCQNKVWLGRVKGNQVGAFTENMEEFDQAKQDEKSRNDIKKATASYNIGDIVKTLTKKEVYLGTGYKYFEVKNDRWHSRKQIICFYDTPKLVHIFRQIYVPYNKTEEELDDYIYSSDFYEKKPKRLIAGHMEIKQSGIKDYLDQTAKKLAECEADEKRSWNAFYCKRDGLQFGSENTCDKEKIKKELRESYTENWKTYPYMFDQMYSFMSEAEYEEYKNK